MSTMIAIADNPAQLQRGRPFRKGCSGNPEGKPKGTRNRATRAAEELLDGEATALTRRAIDLALAGDVAALRLCFERLMPPLRGRLISLNMPTLEKPLDAKVAANSILQGVANGTLTICEAEQLLGVIERSLRILEAVDFERRLSHLERRS